MEPLIGLQEFPLGNRIGRPLAVPRHRNGASSACSRCGRGRDQFPACLSRFLVCLTLWPEGETVYSSETSAVPYGELPAQRLQE
jgi:hypothetical protein